MQAPPIAAAIPTPIMMCLLTIRPLALRTMEPTIGMHTATTAELLKKAESALEKIIMAKRKPLSLRVIKLLVSRRPSQLARPVSKMLFPMTIIPATIIKLLEAKPEHTSERGMIPDIPIRMAASMAVIGSGIFSSPKDRMAMSIIIIERTLLSI